MTPEAAADVRAANEIRRPLTVAPIVNGLVVLLLPPALLLLMRALRLGAAQSDRSITVHPVGWSPFIAALPVLGTVVAVMSPFALLAAWRTRVYVTRLVVQGDPGWRSVGEAGACGGAVATLALLPWLVARPLETVPFVVVYGGAATLAGLAAGAALRMTALLVVKVTVRAG